MSLDSLHLEKNGKGEKVEQIQARQKLEEIQDIKAYLAKIAQPGKIHNPKLQQEVMSFIERAANNNLNASIHKFNAAKFDTDGESGLDAFEFEKFREALKGAITQIISLDGIGAFERIQNESSDTSLSWSNKDKWAAKKADLSQYVLGEKGSTSFAEEAIKKAASLSPEELHKIQEKPFSFSTESFKDMTILVGKELGSGVEDIIRFLGNLPAGVILLSRYLGHRIDINSSDLATKTEGEIKLAELVENNPSLAIIELLGEKGIQMIKQIASMLTSGKQGDIASSLVMLAGLIAGGAGAVRMASNMARKSAIKAAREAGSEARKAGEVMSRESRNTLKTVSKTADRVAKTAGKVDAIVSGNAALGKMANTVTTGVKRVAPAMGMAANDANQINNVVPLQNSIQYNNQVTGAPELLRQLPKTAICSGINLQGMLEWAYGSAGNHENFASKFGNKRFSPESFVEEFNKNAPPGFVMYAKNPGNHEVLEIINTKLKEGTPVPMIYVPIGGNVKAPHFATIVDSGKLPDGTNIYRIQDSMRDVIPKEWLTEKELLESLNFKTLAANNPVQNLALRTVAAVAKWHLGGNTIYLVDKANESSIKPIATPMGIAANDPKLSELDRARIKREKTEAVNVIATSELKATGTDNGIPGTHMFVDAQNGNNTPMTRGYGEIQGGVDTINTRSISSQGVNSNSKISRLEVYQNARLSETARNQKAQELLQRMLTQDEIKAIDYIHNTISKGVYQNSTQDLMKMAREWENMTGNKMADKAKFAEFRKLVENGILGQDPELIALKEASTKATRDIDIYGVDFLLEKIKDRKLNQAQLNAVVFAYFDSHGPNIKSLDEFFTETLDVLGYTGNKEAMFQQAISYAKEMKLERLLSEINNQSIKDILNYIKSYPENTESVIAEILKNGNTKMKGDLLDQLESNSKLCAIILSSDNAKDFIKLLANSNEHSATIVRNIIQNEGTLNTMASEHLSAMDRVLEKMIKDNLFSGSLRETLRTTLALARDKNSPTNQIKYFLQNGDDIISARLRAPFSGEKATWNMLFDDLRSKDNGPTERLRMIERGEIDFFWKSSLDTFFHYTFPNFSNETQRDFVKKHVAPKDGKYHRILEEFPLFNEQLRERGWV